MFRIRRIYNDLRAIDREAIAQVRQIFAGQFAGALAKLLRRVKRFAPDYLVTCLGLS
ncbi:MAG: hypothetical protein KQH53_02595 [Desulfarculaceae bacterium]|nr:hypothetical protein [Desulfarculaceae bacterium]